MQHAFDDDDFDENGVLKDGRSVRVPMLLMDAVQRQALEALHREYGDAGSGVNLYDGSHGPGFLPPAPDELRARAAEAWARRGARLHDAWRGPRPAADQHEQPTPRSTDPVDARARADAAWQRRGERLRNAWRTSP